MKSRSDVRSWRFALVFGAALASGTTVRAAEPARDLQSEVRALKDRVDKLEKQNAELEKALDSERLSENEPPLATRLKAVGFETLGMQKQARTVEALEGITVGVSFTTVAQRANGGATTDGTGESQLNYRADVAVSLPAGSIGRTEGKLFAQVRLGQGRGLTNLQPLYGGLNTTAFQLGGVSQPDNSAALLAQAWYQADIPIGDLPGPVTNELQVNFGKLDPFVFFDQNAAANDETRQFLNNVFVHNALLDAGGDTGADAYGFQPGVRLAYTNETNKPLTYGVSLGIFGAGSGAHFDNAFRSPFAIVQVETHQKFFGGLDGNYRLYAWRNGQATPYNNPAAGEIEKHAGWGLSVDQRVSDNVTLFARCGKETQGRVQFDRAITIGAEVAGGYWRRAADSVGVAFGTLRTSNRFQAVAPTLDADGNGTPDFGYAADAAEQVYELYYRYWLSKEFELTPDVQLIRQPGGNSAAADMKIVGLRAQVTF